MSRIRALLDELRQADSWKVLVADDDEQVREITELVLGTFQCMGRPVTCIMAASGEEALQQMRENGDIVVALLDIVMETEDAGLRVARAIRTDLNNHLTRIVVRTGQAGVTKSFDLSSRSEINAYHEKTDLTARKLQLMLATAIRSYLELVLREKLLDEVAEVVAALESGAPPTELSHPQDSSRNLQDFMQSLFEEVATV